MYWAAVFPDDVLNHDGGELIWEHGVDLAGASNKEILQPRHLREVPQTGREISKGCRSGRNIMIARIATVIKNQIVPYLRRLSSMQRRICSMILCNSLVTAVFNFDSLLDSSFSTNQRRRLSSFLVHP